jgi:hypothetical protein
VLTRELLDRKYPGPKRTGDTVNVIPPKNAKTTLARRSFRRLIETKVADKQIDEVWRILWRDVYPELSVWEKTKFRLGWWFDRAVKRIEPWIMRALGAK